MLLTMAKAGLGILRTAEYAIAADLRAGTLINLFPEGATLNEEPICIVFRSHKHLSAPTRAFVDIVVEAFQGWTSSGAITHHTDDAMAALTDISRTGSAS